ncbi:hypothetical protein HU200_014003 [Digitaria exilis]|uniref:TF-B3 domain-containing protein n=1 Tax=Digitaria exilis TaxID=1010633 RepID=A0A835KKL6_9POAL|nr:hypothetical protein HU200_014003 [Digitaria exilis]
MTTQLFQALTTTFCDAIGLREPCMFMLKTSMDSTRSWLVHGAPCKTGSYLRVNGWKRFCQNSLKEGDICTFNVIKTTLWHVITRCEGNVNQLCYETPESHHGTSSSERQIRPKGSMTYLKARSKCVYDIGPPAWVQKEMIPCALQNHL